MSKMRVLLVDDEVAFTASLGKVLSHRGFDINVATGGLTAVPLTWGAYAYLLKPYPVHDLVDVIVSAVSDKGTGSNSSPKVEDSATKVRPDKFSCEDWASHIR